MFDGGGDSSSSAEQLYIIEKAIIVNIDVKSILFTQQI